MQQLKSHHVAQMYWKDVPDLAACRAAVLDSAATIESAGSDGQRDGLDRLMADIEASPFSYTDEELELQTDR